MKPNPKKLSFSTLAILFAVHVVMCLFAGVLFSEALGQLSKGSLFIHPLVIALGVLIVSHFFKKPEGILSADIVINDTTYAGEFYDIFLMKLLLGFETAAKGLVKIQTGIKKKGTIGTLDVDGFIQAPKDPPTFGGQADVGGRTLIPLEVMGYMEATPAKFEDHWLAVQMNPLLLDRALPVTFESAVVDRTMQVTENWIERAFWQGKFDAPAIATALASGIALGGNNLIFFNGIVETAKTALAAGNKIVSPTAVVLTAGNIVSKFDALKAAILAATDGAAAYNNPNWVWIVNYKTGALYGDAVKAQANKGDDFTGRGKREYDGRRIVEVFGQHDDTIIGCVATNNNDSQLWLGANEADEWTKFKVAKLQANSEKFFIKMLAKICTQVAIPSQIVLYTTK
jgi:hypothetical protein